MTLRACYPEVLDPFTQFTTDTGRLAQFDEFGDDSDDCSRGQTRVLQVGTFGSWQLLFSLQNTEWRVETIWRHCHGDPASRLFVARSWNRSEFFRFFFFFFAHNVKSSFSVYTLNELFSTIRTFDGNLWALSKRQFFIGTDDLITYLTSLPARKRIRKWNTKYDIIFVFFKYISVMSSLKTQNTNSFLIFFVYKNI